MFSFFKNNARFKALFTGLVLLFMAGSLFISCPNEPNNTDTVNAQQPSITVQPQGGTWDVSEDDGFTLTVTANSTDGGTLSYQWYSNTTASTTGGTEIGDDDTLTLEKKDYLYNDDYYFYVVVTNTIDDNGDGGTKTAVATSSVAKVTVSGNLVNARYPSITVQPQGGTWDLTDDSWTEITLTVTATSPDNGELSYQWYNNETNSNTGGEEIEGGTEATITYDKTNLVNNGTYYVYVVVTNTITDNNDGGTKTMSANSNVAIVIITGGIEVIDAEEPEITGQPTGDTWDVSDTNSFTLTVAASVTDGGELSFQWYKNTSNSTTGGIEIEDEDDATLSLAKEDYTTDGNRYFYVEVTNTKDGETATTTSTVAKVTVYGNEVVIPAGLDGYFQTPVTSNLYNDPFYDWPPSGTFWDDGIAVDRSAKTLWYYSDSTMQIGWGGTIASLIPETNTDPALLIVQVTEIKGGAWGPSATGVYFPIIIKNFAASGNYAAFNSANPNSQDPDAKNSGVATLAEAVDEYTDAAKVYFGTTGQYVIHPVTAVTLADLQGKWELEDDPDMYIHIQGTTIMIIYNDPDDDDEYSGVYSFMSDDYCIAMGEIVDYTGDETSGIMYVRVMWSDDYDNDDYLAIGWNNRSNDDIDFYVSAEAEDSLTGIKAAYSSIDDLEEDPFGTFTKQ